MGKGVVRLHGSVGLGLIVEWPSGVIFSNQTGGTFCLQPELEGIYVPLANDVELPGGRLLSPETELAAYFEGPKHRRTGAVHGLDAEDAETIERILAAWRLDGTIEIDRDRLAESHEAWVRVIVNGGKALSADLAPYPRLGVLTWNNSD